MPISISGIKKFITNTTSEIGGDFSSGTTVPAYTGTAPITNLSGRRGIVKSLFFGIKGDADAGIYLVVDGKKILDQTIGTISTDIILPNDNKGTIQIETDKVSFLKVYVKDLVFNSSFIFAGVNNSTTTDALATWIVSIITY